MLYICHHLTCGKTEKSGQWIKTANQWWQLMKRGRTQSQGFDYVHIKYRTATKKPTFKVNLHMHMKIYTVQWEDKA